MLLVWSVVTIELFSASLQFPQFFAVGDAGFVEDAGKDVVHGPAADAQARADFAASEPRFCQIENFGFTLGKAFLKAGNPVWPVRREGLVYVLVPGKNGQERLSSAASSASLPT